MTRAWQPVDPAVLAPLLADLIAGRPGTVRVAVDGPPCAGPAVLAADLVEPLRARGRPAALVDARTFWRDASLRLEYGREDVDSYLTWLDAGTLRREVLDPLGPGGRGTFLPSLRDPSTNRVTRAAPVRAQPGQVVVVCGALLLGAGLPFDLTVHLAMSSAARARRTPPAEAWTLPAFERYDAEADPVEHADVVIRVDDPRHPAVSVS